MFMLTADYIYFCGTKAVNAVSLQDDFPEIAQHADSVRLLSFEITKLR